MGVSSHCFILLLKEPNMYSENQEDTEQRGPFLNLNALLAGMAQKERTQNLADLTQSVESNSLELAILEEIMIPGWLSMEFSREIHKHLTQITRRYPCLSQRPPASRTSKNNHVGAH